MILDMTMTMLERLGYTVLAATAPGEAIRLAQEHAGEIHLLMTDVVMPEMNGRDLAKNLLSLCPRPQTPVHVRLHGRRYRPSRRARRRGVFHPETLHHARRWPPTVRKVLDSAIGAASDVYPVPYPPSWVAPNLSHF